MLHENFDEDLVFFGEEELVEKGNKEILTSFCDEVDYCELNSFFSCEVNSV